MSKQEMARRLIALGEPRSFNTLRKFSVERLESMLEHLTPATLPEIALEPAACVPVATIAPEAPYIPTDAEILAAARPAPVDSVVVHQVGNRWLALALTPIAMLRGVFGL